jgi:hypothetical protein
MRPHASAAVEFHARPRMASWAWRFRAMQSNPGLLMPAVAFTVIVSVTLFGNADRTDTVTATVLSQYDHPSP